MNNRVHFSDADVFVQNRMDMLAFAVYVFDKSHRVYFEIKNDTVVSVPRKVVELHEPTMTFEKEFAEKLYAALGSALGKPSHAHLEGKVEAMKDHLNDMKTLVFNCNARTPVGMEKV